MTGGEGSVDEAGAIRTDIERTRGDMSRTVNAIEERLSPAHLKEQFASVTGGLKADVEHKVEDLKQSVLGNYHEVKDHLKGDLGREVTGAKARVEHEITHARDAFREATVGRVEHMVDDARDTVTDAGSNLVETIRANPIPAALIGVGIGWLLLGGRKSSPSRGRWDAPRGARHSRPLVYGYDEGYAVGRYDDDGRPGAAPMMERGRRALRGALHSAGDAASQLEHRVQDGASRAYHDAQGALEGAGETVSHLVHDAGERVDRMAHEARDRAVHLGEDVRRTGGRAYRGAEQTLESTMRDNPLALGAVALAVGAAIGLSLPHTVVEDEWMGETKERFLTGAHELAGSAIHKAEDAVGQLTSGAGSEA